MLTPKDVRASSTTRLPGEPWARVSGVIDGEVRFIDHTHGTQRGHTPWLLAASSVSRR